MVERGLFQAADLGLADADLLCHLRLGLAVQIAQGNDAALPRCERPDRVAEHHVADPAFLACGVAQLIQKGKAVLAVGVDRLIQARRRHSGFQRHSDVLRALADPGGDFGELRLAPVLLLQLLPRLHRMVGQVADGAADPHGVVVPQVALDLAHDHRHTVGGKPHVLRRVKVIDGFDKPDAAHLEQVVQILPPVGKALDLNKLCFLSVH